MYSKSTTEPDIETWLNQCSVGRNDGRISRDQAEPLGRTLVEEEYLLFNHFGTVWRGPQQ